MIRCKTPTNTTFRGTGRRHLSLFMTMKCTHMWGRRLWHASWRSGWTPLHVFVGQRVFSQNWPVRVEAETQNNFIHSFDHPHNLILLEPTAVVLCLFLHRQILSFHLHFTGNHLCDPLKSQSIPLAVSRSPFSLVLGKLSLSRAVRNLRRISHQSTCQWIALEPSCSCFSPTILFVLLLTLSTQKIFCPDTSTCSVTCFLIFDCTRRS